MDNTFDISPLVRSNIRDLVPYSSARDEFSGSASVFLDANENPYNPPLNRYPDPRQMELKKVIAEMKGQHVENLFLGNGSDEGIDLLFRVFCEPGIDNVITVDPTYGMYSVCARINNVKQKSVLLTPDFQLDVDAVLHAKDSYTKMIFLCSPNNPTSNSLNTESLLRLIDGVDCLVVLDEAYVDFSSQQSMLYRVPELGNLVVLQTLSKAWGLAGLRLGMVFGQDSLITYLSNVKYPYNINTLTIDSALENLAKRNLSKGWINQILDERERIAGPLNSLNFVKRVFPSDSNFLLVQVEHPLEVYEYLINKGVIVRDRSSVPLLEGCLRITVGTTEENERLLEALRAYEQSKDIN